MYRIQTYNQIAPIGLAQLPYDQFDIGNEQADPHAILLRSHQLTTAQCGPALLAVARAGAGTNNVPVAECTEQGVVVFNTPGANANAVKELVLSALLMGCRGIAEGMQYVQQHAADDDLAAQLEAQKKRFKGVELQGKTLGVIGLGAIGASVAACALDLGMNVVGYDPAISVDAAWRLPSAVARMESLEALLTRADFITLHIPALPSTIGLLNQEKLAYLKPGAVLVNFARGSVVDNHAVLQALNEGRLSKYISDFPAPDLLEHEQVLLLPHLGASTQEAEDNCAAMAASQLAEFLRFGNITNSVNFPVTQLSSSTGYRLTFANRNVPGVLGDVLSILAEYSVNVTDMINKSRDQVAYNILDTDGPLTDAMLERIQALEAVVKVRYLPTQAAMATEQEVEESATA